MKKRIKWWLVAMLLVLAGSFYGCGNKGIENAEKAEKSEKVDTAKEKGSPIPFVKEKSAEESAKDALQEKQMPEEGVEMSLMGNIGGEPATLDMNGHQGFYEYELRGGKVERNLELESYDKKSGRVVLRALEKKTGKLVGRFDGTFVIECTTDDEGEEHCANSYCGVFTNVKGAKTEFMLYID